MNKVYFSSEKPPLTLKRGDVQDGYCFYSRHVRRIKDGGFRIEELWVTPTELSQRRSEATLSARRHRATSPKKPITDSLRDLRYRQKFGISLQDYEVKLAEQKGVCSICNTACITGNRLAVDHDHATGAVRGLLCSRCNTGLGKFLDNPDLLVRAADYLKTHQQK